MKKIFLLSVLSLIFLGNISAQKIGFQYEKDDLKVSKIIEYLSKEILKNYTNDDEKTYLDNLFRLQISAKQYDLGLTTLDSLRSFYAESYGEYHKVIGIHYEVYAKMRKNETSPNNRLNTVETLIDDTLSDISEVTKEDSYTNLDLDIKVAEKSFKTKYATTKNQDSIFVIDAIKLIRSHLYFQAAKLIGKSSKDYVEKQLDKKYIVRDSVFIKTRDNANLSTIIVQSKDVKKPLPVILMFSIYPSSYDVNRAKLATNYGYTGVIVYTRGKRYSEDKLKPFEYDGQDAYDAIDWISKQPWCNGKVGMYGGSYLGFAQWASTKNLHPALKTFVPMVSVGTGIDYPMHNNVFMSYMLRWIHYVENNKFTDNEVFRDEEKWVSLYEEWYKKGLAFNQLDSLNKKPSATFQRWLEHPNYDSYWQDMMPYKNDFSKINIPILTLTGYYDDDQIGALHYYNEHIKYNPKANHYLLIGPYDHYGAQGAPDKVLKGYKIDKVAAENLAIPLSFKWFDYVLKDSIKPEILKNKVNYQVMGTNKWKSKPQLQDTSNDSLTLYLDNTILSKNYQLNLLRPEKDGYVREEVNFLDRTKYLKLESVPQIILDTILNARSNNVFVSDVFKNDFEINGAFTANLDVIINKKDLDIIIELYEVTSTGNYFALSTYLGRASYAKNRSKRNLLKPNIKQSIPIKNSSFTSKLIKKGSKLLVVLSVNKNPYWEINYGTGKDVSTESIKDGKISLKIKWLNSSFIKVPIYKY
mgnify:CR=1 FL=1|jgi:hypothetical protein|tara:strand:+ start:53 stop:2308 length:2256 start_codon:yes stop_codon:yes gene_type:complete